MIEALQVRLRSLNYKGWTLSAQLYIVTTNFGRFGHLDFERYEFKINDIFFVKA